MPSSNWTMDKCGVKRVEMIGVGDKRQITVVALFLEISSQSNLSIKERQIDAIRNSNSQLDGM